MRLPLRHWRYPLAMRLLVGLLLNFLLLAALFVALPGRSGLGWDLLLSSAVRERLLGVGDQLALSLAAAPRSEWPSLLQTAPAPTGVRYSIPQGMGDGGPRPRGERPPPRKPDGGFSAAPYSWPMPPADGDFAHGPPAPDRQRAPPGGFQSQREILADMVAVERRGWSEGFALRIPMQVNGQPVDLEVQAAGWVPLLRFLGIADWVLFFLLCLVATGLVWAPFAWRLTRALTALTRATQTIAQGRFDVRVPLARRDELGQLAESVNDMAARLERQVETQKQFVADVAHEVTAPLARLRVGLELLGSPPDARSANVQADLQDDAVQMSTLLDELLLFSRTGQTAGREAAVSCLLADLVQAAVEQETPGGTAIAAVKISVPVHLMVSVPPALVQRALANLVRNALRHGGVDIEVQAEAIGNTAQLGIRDRGPGVPPEALARLGEPFYRPDFARTREQGGTGLGLAIVRRCVAASKGTVVFRNRAGGGFEALMALPLA